MVLEWFGRVREGMGGVGKGGEGGGGVGRAHVTGFFGPFQGLVLLEGVPTPPRAGGRWTPPAANICGVAAHCCGIFSCTKPPAWPVGGVVVAVTTFLVFIHHIIVIHRFSLFLLLFDVFLWFWDGLEGFGRVWEGLGRVGRGVGGGRAPCRQDLGRPWLGYAKNSRNSGLSESNYKPCRGEINEMIR